MTVLLPEIIAYQIRVQLEDLRLFPGTTVRQSDRGFSAYQNGSLTVKFWLVVVVDAKLREENFVFISGEGPPESLFSLQIQATNLSATNVTCL